MHHIVDICILDLVTFACMLTTVELLRVSVCKYIYILFCFFSLLGIFTLHPSLHSSNKELRVVPNFEVQDVQQRLPRCLVVFGGNPETLIMTG